MTDIFRPSRDPAKLLYDVLVAESEKRPERGVEDWILAERKAIWTAARDYAQQNGLSVPTMEQVVSAENQALGHCDYAAKYAFGVSRVMLGG